MKKSSIIAAVTTAISLTTSMAFAEAEEMEKCKIVKDGKGLIKENKAECASSSHSCAGQNKVGDPESWILVPKGQCAKINAGDFSGISKDIQDKIENASNI